MKLLTLTLVFAVFLVVQLISTTEGLLYGQQCSPTSDKCDPNSGLYCDGASATCKCTEGFVFCTVGESCRPPLFGEPCSIQNDTCSSDRGLLCDAATGLCACASGLEHHNERNACLVYVKAGEECDPSNSTQACPNHARCNNYDWISSPDGTWKPLSRCECDYQYAPYESICAALHGGRCCSKVPCHPDTNTICNDGSCACPHPLEAGQSVGNISKCIAKYGAPCGEPGELPCGGDGSNLVCVQDPESSTGSSCRCPVGYTPASNRTTCLKTFGIPCEATVYNEELNSECNVLSGLTCIGGKCACTNRPDQDWDNFKERCASIETRPCLVASYSYGGYPAPMQCISGFYCAALSPNDLYGRCQEIGPSVP